MLGRRWGEAARAYRLESKSEKVTNCLETVPPMDLLSFIVGAAVITNAYLVDAPPPGARDLCAEFDFNAEVV